MESDSDGRGRPAAGSNPRACDNCRLRKVRCDKNSPCSSCKASKSVCRTTQIQTPQKQRVLISSQYEKKIDSIEERLAGIERGLQNLLSSKAESSHDTPGTLFSKSLSERSNESPGQKPKLAPQVPTSNCGVYEGDKTLQEHSVYATEVLERAVDKSVFAGQNPEMGAALASLRDIVSRLANQTTAQEALSSFSSAPVEHLLKDLRLPRQQDVADILYRAKTSPSIAFANFFPYLPISKFTDICADVYRQNGRCSQGKLVIFFAGICHLAVEYGTIQVDHSSIDLYRQLWQQCRPNLELVLSNLNLILPATMENVQALLLGATHGVEISKASVCWVFTSAAANLCQSLGFHRIESMKNDTEEAMYIKQSVFWFVYVMDKNLCLRLGRASSIQDYDISIPRPEPGPKWQMLGHWVKVGEIEGLVYEHLYSPGAFRKSDHERKETAQEIANTLHEAYSAALRHNYGPGPVPELIELLRLSDQVHYLAILCLIYRAAPQASSAPNSVRAPASLSPECIDAPNNPTWSSESMDYNSTVGIQDWFSGNQSIMGLLEQDLDFGQW